MGALGCLSPGTASLLLLSGVLTSMPACPRVGAQCLGSSSVNGLATPAEVGGCSASWVGCRSWRGWALADGRGTNSVHTCCTSAISQATILSCLWLYKTNGMRQVDSCLSKNLLPRKCGGGLSAGPTKSSDSRCITPDTQSHVGGVYWTKGQC